MRRLNLSTRRTLNISNLTSRKPFADIDYPHVKGSEAPPCGSAESSIGSETLVPARAAIRGHSPHNEDAAVRSVDGDIRCKREVSFESEVRSAGLCRPRRYLA